VMAKVMGKIFAWAGRLHDVDVQWLFGVVHCGCIS